MLTVALIATAWLAAAPVDLDAPLKPQPPTLRSEIQRGASAAWDCRTRTDPLDGEGFLRCLTQASEANRQKMGRGYEPFDAGLWRMGRNSFDSLVTVTNGELARSERDVAAAGLHDAEKATGLSDDDVWGAIRSH